jgi:hypothetical protein
LNRPPSMLKNPYVKIIGMDLWKSYRLSRAIMN